MGDTGGVGCGCGCGFGSGDKIGGLSLGLRIGMGIGIGVGCRHFGLNCQLSPMYIGLLYFIPNANPNPSSAR